MDAHSTRFLLILMVALFVTFSCGAVMLTGALMWKDPLTTTRQQAFEAATKIFLVGAGSILGLLGGQAAA
jgi:hypothetical protein